MSKQCYIIHDVKLREGFFNEVLRVLKEFSFGFTGAVSLR